MKSLQRLGVALALVGLWAAQAHAADTKTIAIVLDDSSSMSAEPRKGRMVRNDPKGDAARAAASRVLFEQEGTVLGYFTLGSTEVEGSTPLLVVRVPKSEDKRREAFRAVQHALTTKNTEVAKRHSVDWGGREPHPYWMGKTPCISEFG